MLFVSIKFYLFTLVKNSHFSMKLKPILFGDNQVSLSEVTGSRDINFF